jgi:hypothetical protein
MLTIGGEIGAFDGEAVMSLAAVGAETDRNDDERDDAIRLKFPARDASLAIVISCRIVTR